MKYIILYENPDHGDLAHEMDGNMPAVGAVVTFEHEVQGSTYQVRGVVEQIVAHQRVVLVDVDKVSK